MPREQWKTIPEIPEWEASNLGRIRNKSTRELAKLTRRNTRYPTVNIKLAGGNLIAPVHQLVCRAWIGPPQIYMTKKGKPFLQEVRHLNDDRDDCTLANLCWGTRKENAEDMFKNGIKTRLPKELIEEIMSSSEGPTVIARRLGMHPKRIVSLRRRENDKRVLA